MLSNATFELTRHFINGSFEESSYKSSKGHYPVYLHAHEQIAVAAPAQRTPGRKECETYLEGLNVMIGDRSQREIHVVELARVLFDPELESS